MTRVFTADQLEHYARLVRSVHRLHGGSGGFYTASVQLLPDDLDWSLLEPMLSAMNVPMPAAPVEDSRYRGLAQIADA